MEMLSDYTDAGAGAGMRKEGLKGCEACRSLLPSKRPAARLCLKMGWEERLRSELKWFVPTRRVRNGRVASVTTVPAPALSLKSSDD